jgi:sensor histidine kinase YesM
MFAGAVSFRLAYGFGFIAQNIPAFLYNLAWAFIQFYAFYFFFYRLIEKQRYISYFIWSVVVSVGISLVLTLLFFWLFNIHPNYQLMEFVPQMVGTFIIAQTGSLLRGFIHWFDDIQRKQEVEKTVLRNELDTLNAQLNPHFLFNTLNNIDSLIHSNADKASESLVALSEIMRYMLYDARKPKVPLRNEIDHYRNIIQLQSLRLKTPDRVKFNIDLQDETTEIAPLLFLPFIENAFKHASYEGNDTAIKISLKGTENRVEFSCHNYFRPGDSTTKNKTGGIGLTNLRRRLELLYPSHYALKTGPENSEFVAHLIIEP